jgi:hypothetical protein
MIQLARLEAGRVKTVTSPPTAGWRSKPTEGSSSAMMIVLSGAQVAPAELTPTAMIEAGPPVIATFLSSKPSTNPTRSP